MQHHRPTDSEMLDPDVRFLLANERTLLAWVRTGLTIQAAGFAIIHFSSNNAGIYSGILALMFGGLLAIIGHRRFIAADKAIRSHKLPQVGKHQRIEIQLVVAFGIVLALIQILATINY